MAQTGYTPISLYYSTTAAAVPTAGNLANGELAINITDGKLYYKNNSGVVTLLAGATSGPAGGSNTQVQYNSSGVLAGSANMTFDGTTLTAAGFSGPHNGTVGATTPNTGSFTTLTTSSTVTLNGGTANGVTYLNGSKVLTSGSALVFDGSQFKTSVSGNTPIINETTGGTSNYLQLKNTGGSAYIGSVSNDMAFYTSGAATEQMRLTSTGLGIGTSSPAAKLDIYQSSVRYVRAYPSSGLADLEVVTNNNSQPVFAVKGTGTADLIRAYAGATQAMTLDASGNLGLGVTPSAWGGAFKAFEISGGALTSSSNANIIFLQNAYYDGVGYKYVNTAPATQYRLTSGVHNWYNAPSGTAGTAITFTTAMTLDASGRLGVGTTSPIAKIQGTNDAAPASSGNLVAPVLASAGDGAQGLAFGASTGDYTWIQSAFTNNAAASAASLRFYMGATERMRLDSAGNLGLGVTPSAWYSTARALQLGVTGSIFGRTGNEIVGVASNAYNDAVSTTSYKYIASGNFATNYLQTTGQHQWFTAPSGTAGTAITFTQAMTLDASGNLGVGTSLPAARLSVEQSGLTTTTTVASIVTEATAIAPAILDFDHYTTVDSVGSGFLRFRKANGTKASPTVSTNRATGRVGSQIYDGAAFYDNCLMLFSADGAPTLNSTPGRIQFYTTPSGSTNVSERMRITSNGRLLVGTTTENTSGGVLQVSNGITFPATQSASSDANTLDDYEEGTWTPTQGSAITSVSGTFTASGNYTKVGRLVTINFTASATSFTYTTGNGSVVGSLPFTPGAFNSYGSGVNASGTTNLPFYVIASVGAVYSTVSFTTSSINGTITYFV